MKFVRCDICDKTVDLLAAEDDWLLSAENEDLCPEHYHEVYSHLHNVRLEYIAKRKKEYAKKRLDNIVKMTH